MAGLIVSTPAHAAYGPAGCGWGHLSVDKEENATGLKGAIAVNGIRNQFFSVLLNMGDCKSGGASNVDTFIQDNASELAFESAQGQGENVETVSNMLGCEQANLIATETPTTTPRRQSLFPMALDLRQQPVV